MLRATYAQWAASIHCMHTMRPNNNNKRQSEKADFAPGAARWRTHPDNVIADVWLVPSPGELDETASFLILVFDSGLFAPLCENMTSSTKPELHKALQCRQSRTESHVTCNMYRKCGDIWTCGFETCKWLHRQTLTEKQTYRHADHNTSHPYQGRSHNNTT